MKGLFGGALALFSLLSGAASATTLTIDYYTVPENTGLQDFGVCCSSPPATLPNIALGSSLVGGLPVTTIGGANDVAMINPIGGGLGQILWWTPSGATGVLADGTGTVTLPYTNVNLFAPHGTGANNSTLFQTAVLSGSFWGSGNDVKLTVAADDDALVYLNGKYVGGVAGVHSTETNTLDFGVLTGSQSLEIFYADRAQVGAYLGVSISGVPEPSTWAMMILGFASIGFLAYRRKQNGPQLRTA